MPGIEPTSCLQRLRFRTASIIEYQAKEIIIDLNPTPNPYLIEGC